jgi:hypothetical protein
VFVSLRPSSREEKVGKKKENETKGERKSRQKVGELKRSKTMSTEGGTKAKLWKNLKVVSSFGRKEKKQRQKEGGRSKILVRGI